MTQINSGRKLTQHFEGLILTAKPDAKGKWVWGRGRDIPAPPDPSNPPTCTREEADLWFEDDYGMAASKACQIIGPGIWTTLNAPRQAAVADMVFELGAAGLAEFHEMLAAIRARNWLEAKKQCLDSAYDKEVPNRAAVIADILLTGTWPTL